MSYAGLVITSLSVGFVTGVYLSNRNTKRGSQILPESKEIPLKKDGLEANNSGESTNLATSPEIEGEDYKMVLVVRTDLGMTTGKIAAQCSHATLSCYKVLQATNPALLRQWERAGQTKVALRCSSESELLSLEEKAKDLRLCARSIQDAGRTQIVAGSRTVLGIAGRSRLVNQITGMLRLL